MQSKENWEQILREWKASGKSITTFCRDQQIPIHQFHYHRAKEPKISNFSRIVVDASPALEGNSFTFSFPNGTKLHLETLSVGALKELLS
jgi:hypothetical protein